MDTEIEQWREALEESLVDTKLTDLTVSYAKIARAFPTSQSHSTTFEHSIIDDIALQKWCKDRGWRVELAQELLPDGSKKPPPVRFQRIS